MNRELRGYGSSDTEFLGMNGNSPVCLQTSETGSLGSLWEWTRPTGILQDPIVRKNPDRWNKADARAILCFDRSQSIWGIE